MKILSYTINVNFRMAKVTTDNYIFNIYNDGVINFCLIDNWFKWDVLTKDMDLYKELFSTGIITKMLLSFK
jgi:hypothetical protein